ncbi:hypothetical protein ACTXT7_011259 [Hymenolepis weldensis]
MAAYVKGFVQFSSSAGWIFINGNLQLLSIEFFEHSALGSSLVFQAEVILFESTCRKPPSAGLFIHNIISINLQERYDLPTDGLAPFPPRKFFNNLSPDFVQQRSLEIETYLNSLLLHYTLPPPPLANFIDWNKYDIHGITNCLARQLAKDVYNLPDEDFSYVVDFISQVKQLKIRRIN